MREVRDEVASANRTKIPRSPDLRFRQGFVVRSRVLVLEVRGQQQLVSREKSRCKRLKSSPALPTHRYAEAAIAYPSCPFERMGAISHQPHMSRNDFSRLGETAVPYRRATTGDHRPAARRPPASSPSRMRARRVHGRRVTKSTWKQIVLASLLRLMAATFEGSLAQT